MLAFTTTIIRLAVTSAALLVISASSQSAQAEKRGHCSSFETGIIIPYFANTYGDIWFSASQKLFAIERSTAQCEDDSEDGADVTMTNYRLLEVRDADGVSTEWFVDGSKLLLEQFESVLEFEQEHGWSGKKVSSFKKWKAKSKQAGFKKLAPQSLSPNGKCTVWNQHSRTTGDLAIAILMGDKKLLEVRKKGPFAATMQKVDTYFVPETKTFIANFQAKGISRDIDESVKLPRRTRKKIAATEGWLETVQSTAPNSVLAPCF
tara:strand:+ start:19200 stop:19988 length:789 start_codon:yes stop_codon:yes gene_type:complete